MRAGAGATDYSPSDGATGLGSGLVALRQHPGAAGRVPCFLVGQLFFGFIEVQRKLQGYKQEIIRV